METQEYVYESTGPHRFTFAVEAVSRTHADAVVNNVLIRGAYAVRYVGIAVPIETNNQKNADRIDGYDRDDLGESPDY